MSEWGMQFFRCLTPLHNGAGQGLGAIDRPIIREVTTKYPFVQSSTLKGAYRAKAVGSASDDDSNPVVVAAFGPRKPPPGEASQGCLTFTEGKLLALPARSLAGTFVWATSRLALARLLDLLSFYSDSGTIQEAIKSVLNNSYQIDSEERALGCSLYPALVKDQAPPLNDGWDHAIRVDFAAETASGAKPNTTLGKYSLEGWVLDPLAEPKARDAMARLAVELTPLFFRIDDGFWQDFFCARFLLVPEVVFNHLLQHATEVEANTAIDEKGVADGGSLRYSEYLPAETLLFSLVQVDQPRGVPSLTEVKNMFSNIASTPIQIGADESKGKGIVLAQARGAFMTPKHKSEEE